MIENVSTIAEFPHSDLAVKDQTITLRSVFDFVGGSDELFPFLYGCEKMNCTVIFDNEDITVLPNSKSNGDFQNIILSIYAWIARAPKIANDYMRYLNNISKYSGDFKREPTIK